MSESTTMRPGTKDEQESTAAFGGRSRGRAGPLRLLLAKPSGLIPFGVILVILIGALLPSSLLPHDPANQSLRNRMAPPVWVDGGTWSYPLGTDNLGRDLLSRVVRGARVSLLTTAISVAFGALIGTSLGLIAGYYGGWPDEIISRLIEVQLAFPLMLLMIAIVGALGASLTVLVSSLALASWPRFARLVRSTALELRNREFVEASHALGRTRFTTMSKHVAPNAMSPLIVFITFELSRILLIESALSFLGLGVPPPAPSWGSIIADGRAYLLDAWWISALPGLAIVLLVLAFNMLGDALRDALDPRLAR